MKGVHELAGALESKSLTALTRALNQIADGLRYQLRPPYTEILQLKATEEETQFAIAFEARLYLHYSILGSSPEGIVFTIEFGGEALSDSPAPPTHELFYAGVVQSFQVYAYGSRWKGSSIATPEVFRKNLEVASRTIIAIDIDSFYRMLHERQ